MNNKRKVIVWGYFTKNFGDDLMLKSFINKFNNVYDTIYIQTSKKYKKFYEELGVRVIERDSLKYKIVNKFFTLFGVAEVYYRLAVLMKADFVMLGGSLFAETSFFKSRYQIKNLEYIVERVKNVYVIGSNFGPYYTNEFFYSYSKIFKKCKDVCFRDKYSYNLFSSLPMVRYAPDVILSGLWEETMPYKSSDNSTNVIISVINLENRQELVSQLNNYEQTLVKIIKYHINKNDEVILVSFCNDEGDLVTCNRIKKLCNDNKKIKIISYEDFDFINILSNAKIIYGSRFHSIIISLYYHIPCVPFIYNEKTHNALMTYCKNVQEVNIKRISEYSIDDILKLSNHNTLNLTSNIKNLAKEQFDRKNKNI